MITLAAFESACQDLGIRLFELPPRSPKLNGHVQRAQRTNTGSSTSCMTGSWRWPRST